jgi:two-component system, LytTR family, response regulator
MTDTILKTLIVDDERLARTEMRRLLFAFPQIQLVGEAADISEATELISKYQPDLVFLDIQLVGETGFELLEKVDAAFHLVFVTAYDEYALRAFEVNAMDYLLKSVNPKRLAKTLEFLLKTGSIVTSQSKEPTQHLRYEDILFERVNESLKVLKIRNIAAITAEGDYSRIHTIDGKTSLVTRSLKKWELILPQDHFMRIHRSTIINLDRVQRIEKYFRNTYQVYIESIRSPLEMSRRYSNQLKKQSKIL